MNLAKSALLFIMNVFFSHLLMFNRKKKIAEAVTLNVAYEEKISRVFIFRFLWVPVIIAPFALYSIWFALLSFIHFFYMLVLGARSKKLFDHQMTVIRYLVEWQLYLRFFTNKRPNVLL